MSITLASYTFPGSSTHQVPEDGDWENDPIYASFFGVAGSVELRDALHGRMIPIEVRFSGYATEALLNAAKNTVDAKVGTLNDSTLTVVGLNSTVTFPHCTFQGLMRNGSRPQKDGSGTNGWYQDMVLMFRQLQRTA